ncbi:TPA: TetR/AcrR family transcriptional regulator [Streptococcus suis]|nr:TetR/AcrR family transcriptional regulator [Streptococcus suis]HEL1614720.1 TetR/AcrR family transcriptional regulator [Streptococcus suis]HEL2164140.1 TetR/AcrR family transcriptional regulator [Streptococcus suis]HEL2218179.1 TetR/AcrR family transcriptional regulator [Streptococcus suis]HEM2697266.1 TetR/AcrR family transcriptional regulator [Streptococcus suis]
MGTDSRKERTRQAILEAMVTCLESQGFNDITTTHLAQTAGISRSSFYTHYKDKYELIDSYQQGLFHKLEAIFDRYDGNRQSSFLEIFELLYREKLLSALLTHNGTQEIQNFLINKVRLLVANDLAERLGKEDLSQLEKEYSSIYFSHAFFGIMQVWIKNGKQESPQYMTDFLIKMLP